MLSRIALILSLAAATPVSAANLLEAYCLSNNGTMVKEWTCPSSGRVRPHPACKVMNEAGEELIFNGCTGMAGRFSELFFGACILHDFCYHHEPSSNGKSKAACDRKLYRDAMHICATQNKVEKGGCQGAAQVVFAAVTLFGSSSWECSKIKAKYPTSLSEI